MPSRSYHRSRFVIAAVPVGREYHLRYTVHW